ncbi:DUF445 domain-containing protein [Nocardia sp. 2]|uniref:DUF445 domain-containing protein n=1 Tax=Nocardia acididurans TaxID=2802282 RepID=A0ABS1MH19_9NOCA|nr:DUF445 family protein [Nocardia acididurans]MBL1079963.1 DUF445 domain-containing protein [Nocardia acididurans]
MIADFADNWLLYLSIPVVAALIGWITKIVAVEMLMRPLHFVGIPPYLGWQGVVPRASARMATIAVDLMFTKLIDPQEMIDRIDVTELTTRLRQPLDAAVDHMVREMMMRHQPRLWVNMPPLAQRALIERVQEGMPQLIEEIVLDLRTNIDQVMDLRGMAIDTLVNDKALLVEMVRRVGRNELRFIVRSGLIFGTVLGLVQMLVWAFTHNPLLMPAFGGFTGLVTDWLALQMIFRPVKPFGLGPFRWQGMFHRRRENVCADYADLIANEIFTPAKILEAVLEGERADRLASLLAHRMRVFVDGQAGPAKPLVMLVAKDAVTALETEAVTYVLDYIRTAATLFDKQAIESLDMQSLVVEKTRLLTDDEYEGLLRPAFKQDEWKLVAIGAVLGFLVGELQVQLILG